MAYPILTTVNSVKAWLKITSNADDAELGNLVTVASEIVGRFCGRDNLGAVNAYTENYFGYGNDYGMYYKPNFTLLLRRWPIVSLTAVTMNNTPITILDETGLQSNQSGVFLEDGPEPRRLKFRYLVRSYPITVSYTAGYPQNAVPWGLQQACNQVAAEIFRNEKWATMKSISMGGETTSYDEGKSWGLSNRTQQMLKPYQNIVPFQGQ